MTTDQEDEALNAGGNAGGEYLESIGVTDLAALDAVQWREFLARILEGYSAAMREAAKTTAPF